MASSAEPLIVEVTRGPLVESRHRVAAAVVDADGTLAASWGDIALPVYPRSANKPLQALALLESGAADRWALGDAEIALACASHMGEPRHVATVGAWLDRMGLSAGDLECGTHLPYDEATAHALIRSGDVPSPLHNNCSGKHTGFLATAVHLGEPHRGYIGFDHPVQRRIRTIQSEICGIDLDRAAAGVDGCGIPTLALPLPALALGMARLVDTRGLSPARAAAAGRIVGAMAAEPVMVSGTGRFPTAVMQAIGAAAVVKSGAEGVYAGALRQRGLGFALKVEDGNARGAEVAAALLLRRLGVLDDAAAMRLVSFVRPTVRNRVGLAVGEIRPAAEAAF